MSRIDVTLTEPQKEMLMKTERYPAFVGGYGCGKSQSFTVNAFQDVCVASDALVGLYAPTFDLMRLITAPRMCNFLDEHGIRHKWNKQDKAIYNNHPGMGDFIMRTLDDPERIVGFECFSGHVDELDILKAAIAEVAWNKIIARTRQTPTGVVDPKNRICIYTTPEGFKFVYHRWVVLGGPEYTIVKAPTSSNPWLPKGYIESLYDTYPPNLVEAYINGEFVNMANGVVYSSFKRDEHGSHEKIKDGEDLYIGQDFNVGHMASVIMVKRDNSGLHAVGELTKVEDTPQLIKKLKKMFPKNKIYIYPDASGTSRKTVNASKSDIMLLREAGWFIHSKMKNPPVKDRILAMNSAFQTGKVHVNSIACPELVASLEQQSYADNGEPDKTSGHDHLNDAMGYAVHYMHPVRRTPFTQKVIEEMGGGRSYFKKGEASTWKTT